MMRVLNAGWDPIGDWPPFHTTNAGFFTADSIADYIGGMPVGLNGAGATSGAGLVAGGSADQVIVTAPLLSNATLTGVVGASNFLGLLFNNATIDIRRGAGNKTATAVTYAIPTIVPTPCYVELWQGTPGSTDLPVSHDVVDDRPPFLEGDSWVINDLIYIEESATASLNGRLTRASGGSNTGAIGRVLKAPADETETMKALFWTVPAGQQGVAA